MLIHWSFGGQQGKPIFKSKGSDDKAIDQLIKELDDLTLSDTMHALELLKCSWSATAWVLKGLEETFLAEIARGLHELHYKTRTGITT